MLIIVKLLRRELSLIVVDRIVALHLSVTAFCSIGLAGVVTAERVELGCPSSTAHGMTADR